MKRVNFLMPVLVLALGLLSSCGGDKPQEKAVARYVKSAEVLPSTGGTSLIYNGVVKEQREVALSFKVGGNVEKLLVQEGDYVKKGQLLAQIDKRDYAIHVQATEAQYTQVKGEYERYQELYKRKQLPENTLEKLKAGYLMAKSQYEAAANALADTDLKAPFSGYINKKFIENFQTVGPGQTIVNLIDISDLEVVVSIPEGQINAMSDVAKITCDIRNANQFDIPSKVKSLSEKSGKDRMYEAKISLLGDVVKNIKPGMVAKVKVTKGAQTEQGFLVPVEAVFSSEQAQYVWLIDESTMRVKKTQVSVLKIKGDGLIEIKDNIKVGQQVVTAGVHTLIEGQEIKILPSKSETNVGGLL